VGKFWDDHPILYYSKQALLGFCEFFFLIFSIKAIYKERNNECSEETEDKAEHRLGQALLMLQLLHVLHLVRLVYKILTKAVASVPSQGVVKCLLMDCYCSCAFFFYTFSQIVFFTYSREEIRTCRPLSQKWLLYEICYQYGQVLFYFIINLTVVFIIVFQQK